MTPRDRRALWIGGAVIGVAILGLRVGPWAWRATRQTQEALEARQELLARMRTDVREAPSLEDSGVVVRRRVAALAGSILSPRREAEAGAALAALVSAAADRGQARVNSTEVVADSTPGSGVRRVAVRVSLESDTAGLLALLGGLARTPEALVVDQVRIAAADADSPAHAELLRVELRVIGWYLPDGSTP